MQARYYLYLAGAAWGLSSPARAQSARPDSLRPEAPPSPLRVASAIDSAGECTEVLTWGTPAALVRTFYPSGQLREYLPYAHLALGQRHGVSSSWYASGRAASLEPYADGRREGELLLYCEDGRLKRQAHYQAGAEQSSRCYDAQGQPLAYFPYEQAPLYPGGLARLSQEINQRLRRAPELSRLYLPLPTLVSISFLVNPDGHLSEPRVEVPSREPALDQAVLRAVQQLSRPWLPGRRDGQLITFRYRLPIEFKSPVPYRTPARL